MKFQLAFLLMITISCTTEDPTDQIPTENPTKNGNGKNSSYSYLALGDSYTIGQGVCSRCSFPVQLAEAFQGETENELQPTIIARTGWRTDDLIRAIENENPSGNYDLVTLLIGVNNQYQGRSFSQYEKDFISLLNTAINLAGGDPEKVVVLSIPDYAFTPFGQQAGNAEKISSELDTYNAYAKAIAESQNVKFLNITDITRRGLDRPDLVADDDLHPSAKAYAHFVERLLPIAEEILITD